MHVYSYYRPAPSYPTVHVLQFLHFSLLCSAACHPPQDQEQQKEKEKEKERERERETGVLAEKGRID